LHELEAGAKYMVSATRVSGDSMAFFQAFEKIEQSIKGDTTGKEEKKQ